MAAAALDVEYRRRTIQVARENLARLRRGEDISVAVEPRTLADAAAILAASPAGRVIWPSPATVDDLRSVAAAALAEDARLYARRRGWLAQRGARAA